MEIGPWIAVFVSQLLLYLYARKRPPATRFLENTAFWRWSMYSMVNVIAALIVYTLMRALGLFGNR